jgi:hypothetical protein
MKYFKKIILVLLFLFPISNSFGAMVTFVQRATVDDSGTYITGVNFNADGTKLFTVYHTKASGDYNHVSEYNLSTPFDISTRTYAGDDERCILNSSDTTTGPINSVYDLEFSNDGTKLFVGRGGNANGADHDRIFRFDLTTAYDISTCSFVNQTSSLDSDALQNGSNAGDITSGASANRLQGLEINDDGTKLFLIFHHASDNTRLLEYQLSTPYDLTTISLVANAGMELEDEVSNPQGMRFSSNGKRIWSVNHTAGSQSVTQISLDVAYSTSSFTIDGTVLIENLGGTDKFDEPRGIAFSAAGLKMYLGTDRVNQGDSNADRINEIDLVCPFNIIAGKCPSITENSDRTGMAEAQIMIAKRIIDHSTKSALHRLEWIRRNKDNQNLTNLNNFNTAIQFYNPLLNYWVKKLPDKLVAVNEAVEGGLSITIGREYKKRNKNSNNLDNFNTAIKSDNPLLNSWMNKLPEKITAGHASVEKKTEDKKQDLFFWSEGSIAVGRVGDTSISSTKKIGTGAITVGADKFTNNNGIKGLAFRVGRNNVDVGTAGSNLDTDTYNITYYATSPVEDDTKFIDIVIGFGKLKSDLLTVLDGKNLTADRTGNQLYGTIKIKDEIKKDNLILIPSGRFDYGHTILSSYKESGNGAIDVKKQHVEAKKLRAAIAMVEDLSNDKYTFKRHGKLEYVADIDRSSNFKYTYVSDNSTSFNDTLHTGALHNLNGEIGFDIIFPEHYSIFVIYERNHAFGSGYTDNIHIALGYLPHKDTEYAFSVDGSDNLMSQFEIKKNINGYDFSFNLKNDLTNLGNDQETSINLNKIF